MVWKNHILNISNSGRWDQTGKEDVKEITSGIPEGNGNQTHEQLAFLNKDKTDSREYYIPRP